MLVCYTQLPPMMGFIRFFGSLLPHMTQKRARHTVTGHRTIKKNKNTKTPRRTSINPEITTRVPEKMGSGFDVK